MNEIQGTKPAGKQWNRLLDAVAKMNKYKKITTDHVSYIKVFSDGTVSYLIVSANDVLNTTNNATEFTELKRFFEQHFEMKVQEGYVLKYLTFRIL